jgi:predicted DsbA family dithiol-disulfide isomerase/uncharacterized membrane protein
LRCLVLVALAASAALLADYLSETPTFCSPSSGCGIVRRSALSYVLVGDETYVPLPVFGVLGFSLLFGASFSKQRWAPLVPAMVGAAAGLYLLMTQAISIGAFCWLCVVVDVAAVGTGAAALLAFTSGADEPALLRGWAWPGLFAIALGAPLLWPRARPAPPVPEAVLAYYRPGKINVVEFADFECPACRAFHGVLKPVLASYGERVHFVRLNKPLRSHPHAEAAARAAVCGEELGRTEPMADALFAAEDLSSAGLESIARGLGLDLKAFQDCLSAPKTRERVERETNLLAEEEFEGLPTTFIAGKRLIGAHREPALRDALDRAARGEGESGVPGPVYALLVLLAAAGVVYAGRVRAPRA